MGMIPADSRRLTGPSLLLDRPGAILDVQVEGATGERAVEAWRRAARRFLDAVGWPKERLAVRTFHGGASLALTAPADALYAATELNEAAWESAWAEASGDAEPDAAEVVARLRAAVAAERNPALLALREAAHARGVTFLAGEGQVSVGSGTGVALWPVSSLPSPSAIDWSRVHDVPVALVTGSNGKTTVVRLLAAILAETGRTVGITSTDGAFIRGALVGEGDYSGPSGARLVLRRPEVEAAVLETARGGLLRRGLSLDRADVAVVTNVADDHLGEFGIQQLDELAQVKLLVTRAVGPGGAAVLNADDPLVVRHSSEVTARIVWFSLEPARDEISAHLAAGGRAVLYESGALALAEGPERTPVVRGEEMPAAMGGAARHNVANALAAIGAANAMGVPPEAMGRALRRFGLSPEDNVGRANLIELGGVRVLIDYAHNPHGMEALVRMSAALPAVRRLVLIGQAGDRSDESIRALARGALALKPDRVVLKEMERYLRGRAPGEVPAIMAEELERAGLPASAVSRAGTEVAAVVDALSWAHSGDLLLLTVHQDRPQVLALLERLRTAGWQAGEAVPG